MVLVAPLPAEGTGNGSCSMPQEPLQDVTLKVGWTQVGITVGLSQLPMPTQNRIWCGS